MEKIKGTFSLIDLSTTHNQILFRRFGEKNNIDLLFEGVSYIDVPWSFANPEFETLANKPESKTFLSDSVDNVNKKFVSMNCAEGTFFVLLKRILICENNYIGDSTSIPSEIDPDGEKERVDAFMKALEDGVENPELEVVRHDFWKVLIE